MRSPFRLTLLPNQYPAIHGLRVLGIVSVIQAHLSFELGARKLLPESIHAFSQRIWFGMDLFFVLSGFLIGNILLSSEGTLDAKRILRFYARRSFRIIPLYYLVLTLLAWSSRLDPLQKAQLWREYAYLTNYSDTAHVVMFWGWSLCVEEHFYLLVPLVVVALRKLPGHRARIVMLVALWLSALAVRTLVVVGRAAPLDDAGYFREIYVATHTRYDTLIAGVLIAYVHRHFGDALRARLSSSGARWLVLAASVALFVALLYPPPFIPQLAWGLMSIGTVTGVTYALFLTFLLFHDGLLARLLSARVFLPFATLGYGVYLIHMPFVVTTGIRSYQALQASLGPLLAFVVSVSVVFAACLVVAYVLHLLVEKPALWLRDRTVPTRAPAARSEAVAADLASESARSTAA